MSAPTNSDRSKVAAERAVSHKRGALGLAVAVLFCLVAALLPGGASAHDPKPTQEPYEVEVEKTRQVPVYEWVDRAVRVDKTREVPVYTWVDEPVMGTRQVPVYTWVDEPVMGTRQVPVYTWVDEPVMGTRQVPVYEWVDEDVYGWVPVPRYKTIEVQVRVAPFTETVPVYTWVSLKVRVAPFTETYTYYPPCELITTNTIVHNYCPPGETKTRPVYNYKSGSPFQVQTGTEEVPVYNYKTETREVPDGVEQVWLKTGTRRVQKQTGTKTETYDTGQTRRVQKQTGTKTETYDTGQTRRVQKQTGTKTETYDTGQTRRVQKQTGTRTETYSVTETRKVKVDTGRTTTETYKAKETRYRDVCPADHTLQNGKCAHPAPTPEPTPPPEQKCPSGQYKAPLPTIRIAQTSNGPRLVTEEQVAQDPSLALYAELADWQKMSSNPDCYKPVIKEGNKLTIPWGQISSAITNVVTRVLERQGEQELKKSESYMAANRVLHIVLCNPFEGTAAGAAAAAYAAKIAKEGKKLAASTWTGVTVNVVIEGYCLLPADDDSGTPTPTPDADDDADDDSDSNQASDDSDDSDSDDSPTAGVVGGVTLVCAQAVSATRRPQMTLSWDVLEGALFYRYEVQTADGDAVASSIAPGGASSSRTIEALPRKAYKARVQAYTTGKGATPWTEWATSNVCQSKQ